MRPRHPKKEIEEALCEAEAAGWTVIKRDGRTHAWGLVRCKHGCCQQSVNSTPRVPENEASRIRRALQRCPGADGAMDPQEPSEEEP